MPICPNCGMYKEGTEGRFCPTCRLIMPYVHSTKGNPPFDRKKIINTIKKNIVEEKIVETESVKDEVKDLGN